MFHFYRYIKPDEYRLAPGDATHPQMKLPDFRTVPKEYWGQLHWQEDYRTEAAMLVDAGFQLWKRGYLWQPGTEALPAALVDDLEDNYRFVRTWFGPRWAAYLLWLRWREGETLAQERAAWRATKSAGQMPLSPMGYDPGHLPAQFAPSVSVIITSRNRPGHLRAVLGDLLVQSLAPSQVVVVDQSVEPIAVPEGVDYHHRPDLVGQWSGRNAAVALATGDFLAFVDDDVRLPRHWLQRHFQVLLGTQCQVSTGLYVPKGSVPKPASPYYASQWNANNSVMRRSVWEQVGPFDTAYDGTRWGDHAFGMAAYQAGFVLVQNPLAVVEDQAATHGGLREGDEPSYRAYRIGQRPQVARGVQRYFATYFGAAAYRRWCHTRLPWQGRGGLGLVMRLFWYWLKIALGHGPKPLPQDSVG